MPKVASAKAHMKVASAKAHMPNQISVSLQALSSFPTPLGGVQVGGWDGRGERVRGEGRRFFLGPARQAAPGPGRCPAVCNHYSL